MAAQILQFHTNNHHVATLSRIANAVRILATAALTDSSGNPTADLSALHDEVTDLAERIANIDGLAGAHVSASLRLENALRIIAVAALADVDENPLSDASVLHDALLDIADRIANLSDAIERDDMAARRVA